ncbi:MAG: DNA repair protein RadC, partial [Simkaniaceae bacterium]|nr:DNA repair protein RadC [Simkaniaceae bacterium]
MLQSERPRERLQKHGIAALSTPELIAILLGTGTQKTSILDLASDIVNHFGSVHTLLEATPEELKTLPGIGTAKALQLKAAFGLAQRYSAERNARQKITTPLSLFNAIKHHFFGAKQEHLVIALRDVKGKLIHSEIIATGTLTQVLTHPREIFSHALNHKAHSIAIAHNHPSNDPR